MRKDATDVGDEDRAEESQTMKPGIFAITSNPSSKKKTCPSSDKHQQKISRD